MRTRRSCAAEAGGTATDIAAPEVPAEAAIQEDDDHRTVDVAETHDEVVRMRRLVRTTPEQRWHAARRARERWRQASARQEGLL